MQSVGYSISKVMACDFHVAVSGMDVRPSIFPAKISERLPHAK